MYGNSLICATGKYHLDGILSHAIATSRELLSLCTGDWKMVYTVEGATIVIQFIGPGSNIHRIKQVQVRVHQSWVQPF